jgi:superfamily I DNA/RNA helicase
MTTGTRLETDAALAAAFEYPAGGPALALVGPAGTGKSFALVRRALAIAPRLQSGTVLVSAPDDAGTAHLRAVLGDDRANVQTHALSDLALETLRAGRSVGGHAIALDAIDDVTAAALFEDASASLFSLEWPELAAAEIDPEITGLRSPQRFAAAAFRLIKKLRAALVSPEAFKAKGLRGAVEFYGRTPNLAHSDLLRDTASKHRDSLRVSPAELERQRAREVDLVLVLTRLYETYVATLAERHVVTAGDAVFEATFLLRARADLRDALRSRYPCAAIDDAQDLTGAQVGFLAAIYGERLDGVTLAGDAAQATRGFAAGARGAENFKSAATTIAFSVRRRSSAAIERIALLGLDPLRTDLGDSAASAATGDAVTMYRAEDDRDEARFIVQGVERLLASGTPPGQIAVITRHLACAHAYVDALLARDVPVDVSGSIDLYEFPAVQDALAALWAAIDPFRHDYLLRNLEAPWLRLCDASIATLCGEARDPQPLLFELPDDDEDEARARRWDLKRDLRLGRNVTRGDVDAELPAEARERIVTFRAARERWESWTRTHAPSALARAILGESVLATRPPGARGRFEAGLIDRLCARVDAFEEREPLGTLEDFLLEIDRAGVTETDPPALVCLDAHALRVLDVEAAKGATFEAVFIPDLRAGAWPRYYVPDAFLFMPSTGMIAKENVGDATTARTAKFTYTLFRHRLRDKYNTEERRAFYCAATRARTRLFLCASGRTTRGANTPEILCELEKKEAACASNRLQSKTT